MKTLNITTKQTESGKTCYTFTQRNIDYTLFVKADSVDVYSKNNQRGGHMNSNTYWNFVDNQGRTMAKFMQNAITMITA